MDADIFISLSHFKGHEATGFGGALKNIGMGCGSRAGKMQQHASGKPAINTDVCRGCHRCAKECGAMQFPMWIKKQSLTMTNAKDAAAASVPAVLMRFIIQTAVQTSFLTGKWRSMRRLSAMDVRASISRWYRISARTVTAMGENDAPILPDIGMFASFDPVALDQACADACLKATPIENSQLGEHLAERDGTVTTTISRIPTRILNGRQPSTRQRKLVLVRDSMN